MREKVIQICGKYLEIKYPIINIALFLSIQYFIDPIYNDFLHMKTQNNKNYKYNSIS